MRFRQSSSFVVPRFASSNQAQQGQVGVVVLLIMVVLLTVGLSVAARTTQDLFLSQQQVDTTRVFNAAEAGVDQALSGSLDFTGAETSGQIGNFNDSDIAVNYSVTKVNKLETRLFEMVSVMVDVGGNNGNGIVIDWSKLDDCASQDVASLIASVYYDDAGTVRVRHYPLRGCDRGDNFLAAASINDSGYRRRYTLPLTNNDLFVRLKPLYNDVDVRVDGDGWTMPVQYYHVRSEATNSRGNETRIVEVNRTLAAAPSIFDFAAYSGSSIVK